MNKAIIVDHLSKEDLLHNISFTIQSGEFVGLIANDEKSRKALFQVISGLVKPSSGFVSVLGFDPYIKSSEFLKQLLCIDSLFSLTNDLAPINMLEITKSVYNLSSREFNRNLSELTQYIKNPILLDSLIYKPKVILLNNVNVDIDLIYEYNKNNESAVLISSNTIDNLVGQVRRIIIIDEGRLLYDGAIDEIVTKYAKEKIIKAKLSTAVDPKKVAEIGEVRKYVHPYIYVQSPRDVSSFTAAELIQNFPVTSLTIEEISIEDIITNIKK